MHPQAIQAGDETLRKEDQEREKRSFDGQAGGSTAPTQFQYVATPVHTRRHNSQVVHPEPKRQLVVPKFELQSRSRVSWAALPLRPWSAYALRSFGRV